MVVTSRDKPGRLLGGGGLEQALTGREDWDVPGQGKGRGSNNSESNNNFLKSNVRQSAS